MDSTANVIKALSRETKALILVSEFEARRLPMFQMRAVLNEIIASDEEKKIVIDLVENDLKATGYHPDQINAFLQDLLALQPTPDAPPEGVRSTRRLRSPFSVSFDDNTPVPTTSKTAFPVMTASSRPTPPVLTQAPIPPKVTPPLANISLLAPVVSQPSRPMPLPPPPSLPGFTPIPPAPVEPTPTPEPPRNGGTLFFGAGSAKSMNDSRFRALLADDDKRIRIVFRLCLERLGLKVMEAEDGSDAWKKLEEQHFNIMVLDMKMPGLHGLEVLTRISNKKVDLPVIICSAFDNLREEFVVNTYPKLRYLVKPVSAEKLEAVVRELLPNLPPVPK